MEQSFADGAVVRVQTLRSERGLRYRNWVETNRGKAGRNSERALHGPMVVLINEDTGSNGEFFAQVIKE